MGEPTLLPCPFCGGDDLLPSVHDNGHQQVICIACEGCEAEGPATIFRQGNTLNDKARAAAKWNQRAALLKASPGGTKDAG
jgi:Lar family restriction alleviation protein